MRNGTSHICFKRENSPETFLIPLSYLSAVSCCVRDCSSTGCVVVCDYWTWNRLIPKGLLLCYCKILNWYSAACNYWLLWCRCGLVHVHDMTYSVFGGTLSLNQSISHRMLTGRTCIMTTTALWLELITCMYRKMFAEIKVAVFTTFRSLPSWRSAAASLL